MKATRTNVNAKVVVTMKFPCVQIYSFSLLPTMISQAGDMAWLGSSGGCAVYYFITSWLVGLSNYLVVCLVCMILVKRRNTCLNIF